jgi:hypothetical protein
VTFRPRQDGRLQLNAVGENHSTIAGWMETEKSERNLILRVQHGPMHQWEAVCAELNAIERTSTAARDPCGRDRGQSEANRRRAARVRLARRRRLCGRRERVAQWNPGRTTRSATIRRAWRTRPTVPRIPQAVTTSAHWPRPC